MFRDGLEAELAGIETEIKDKEVEIMEIEPGLDSTRAKEVAERKRSVISSHPTFSAFIHIQLQTRRS